MNTQSRFRHVQRATLTVCIIGFSAQASQSQETTNEELFALGVEVIPFIRVAIEYISPQLQSSGRPSIPHRVVVPLEVRTMPFPSEDGAVSIVISRTTDGYIRVHPFLPASCAEVYSIARYHRGIPATRVSSVPRTRGDSPTIIWPSHWSDSESSSEPITGPEDEPDSSNNLSEMPVARSLTGPERNGVYRNGVHVRAAVHPQRLPHPLSRSTSEGSSE